jgi:metal-responsive CopG/Arc/MetJ family transcriptional regulator
MRKRTFLISLDESTLDELLRVAYDRVGGNISEFIRRAIHAELDRIRNGNEEVTL